MRKWLRMTGWTVAGLLLLAGLGWALLQTSWAHRLLAQAISEAASSETVKVEVTGLEGWLPEAPRIGRITLSDKAGIWLELEDIAIDWHPLGLFRGTTEIARLSVKEIRWLRRPEGGADEGSTSGSSIPSIVVAGLEIKALKVDEAVAGQKANLTLAGRVDLRDPARRAIVTLSLQQTDGDARVEGDIDWNPGANIFRLSAQASDGASGILPRLAGLPLGAPLSVNLGSSGTLDDWTSTLKADLGPDAVATGKGKIRRDGSWYRLEAVLDARLKQIGPASWQPWIEGDWTLDLRAARNDAGAVRLDRLDLKSPAVLLTARLEGEGLNAPLRMEARTEALPRGPVDLEVRAVPDRSWSEVDGSVLFDGKVTQGAAAASFKGTLSPDTVKTDLSLGPTDLQALALGKGLVTLTAKLGLSRTTGALSADGQGSIEKLVLGDPMIDGLIGGRADLSFAFGRDADGKLGPARISVKASRMSVDATLSGPRDAAVLSATGEIAGKPLSVSAVVETDQPGTTRIRKGNLSLGRVRLAGDLQQSASGLSGEVRLVALNLADISPFLNADIDGPATGTFELSGPAGRTEVRTKLSAQRLRIDTTSFDDLKISGRIREPLGAMALQLEARAAGMDAGGLALERLAATGQGPLAAFEVSMTALHKGAEFAARARLKIDRSPIRIALATASLMRDGRELRLATPEVITIAPEGVDLSSVNFEAGAGTLRVDGKVGRQMALRVEPRALPLWVVGLVAEPLPVSGNVSGSIRLKGQASDPLSEFDLTLTGISAEGGSAGAMRDVTLAARGTTDQNGASVKGQVSGPRGARLGFSGRIPFSETAAMNVDLDGKLDVAMANAWLGASGERAGGRLTLSARVAGRLSSPTVSGSGALSDGFFRSASAGLELRGIEASIEGSERRIVLSRLLASTPDGGTVAAEGTISMDAAAGYPVNLTVTASNAKLVSTTLTTLTADVQARMSGALMQNPLVSGTVSVDRWDIRVPERLAATLTPIKVTHRNAPAGFVTGEEEDDEAVGSALPFRLDVAVRAPREVFVRGQGIDAEFGGEARLGGTLDDPAVRGRFDLRRGAVNVLSQRIILSRGSVQFLGGAEPVLDIAGSVTKNGVAATVSVKGRAGDPQIALSSTPSLPQDEILSRLLFSKQTTQLSPFEAAQLAQVIGRWSGLNTGPDILERLRTVIGIDALTATTDPTGKTSVAAGSYLGRGVYVGVSEAAGGSATVDVDLTDTIKLRGEAGTTGTKVGVAAEWEY